MEEYCPFPHIAKIIKHIPDCYFRSEANAISYKWFITAPKYSSFRVNTLKVTCQEIVSSLREQLHTTDGKSAPTVEIHPALPDCIVIGYYRNNSENHTMKCTGDVIVDIPCANAVLRGADVFAPGILGLSSDVKEGDGVTILADMEQKCLRGFNKHFEGKTHIVGLGILKMNRNDLFRHNNNPKGVGVQVIQNISGIPRINFPRQLGILQNLPSIVCGHLFSNISGRVLDMCAAPGNKTTHIASILGSKGHVIALDKTPGKVERIVSLCSEMGVENVTCFAYDSTKCLQKMGPYENSEKPPFAPSSFSAILLDPPCSALGQRPTLFNDISSTQLKSYVSLQRKLFRTAVEALMPGGMLVYSTCTITLEENEEMVSWALKEFSNISLEKICPAIGREGITSSLSKENQSLVSRFGSPPLTTPDDDTIGFFIARFVKS